jgi:hypothetical protein
MNINVSNSRLLHTLKGGKGSRRTSVDITAATVKITGNKNSDNISKPYISISEEARAMLIRMKEQRQSFDAEAKNAAEANKNQMIKAVRSFEELQSDINSCASIAADAARLYEEIKTRKEHQSELYEIDTNDRLIQLKVELKEMIERLSESLERLYWFIAITQGKEGVEKMQDMLNGILNMPDEDKNDEESHHTADNENGLCLTDVFNVLIAFIEDLVVRLEISEKIDNNGA